MKKNTIVLAVFILGLINWTIGQTVNYDIIHFDNSNDKIYHHSDVDSVASFPRGEFGLQKWLNEKLKYPSDARHAGIEGLVVACFIVEIDGSITNPKILKGIHPSCDAEFLRVISLLPKWNPAIINGEYVRQQVFSAVRFHLGRD